MKKHAGIILMSISVIGMVISKNTQKGISIDQKEILTHEQTRELLAAAFFIGSAMFLYKVFVK